MQFDVARFLTVELKSAQDVLALFSAYGIASPPADTVYKWFQRGSVPAAWLPTILAVIEIERGEPVSLTKYVSRRPQ